jgi:probable HAF family extracellular repeat protein/cysteine-rich repeat protein
VAVWYGWNSLGGTIGSTDHDILVARSMNDGVTWTPPAALNTNAGSDSGNDTRPRVATDGRGTWVAAWQSFDSLDGTIGTDSDILVARSTDGGASWSAPAALNTNASSDAGDDWRPHLTTDGQGTWVAVWYSFDTLGGTIGIDSDILVARSTDGGASWSAPAALNTSAGYDYLNAHDERPQVATDGLGNWLTVWESEYSFGAIGNDSDIVASRSTDGGATWTQARALNSDAGGDFRTDFAVRVATDSQGAWVAAWTSGGTDWDIEVARSSDAGAGWTWPVFLNSNAAWDGGGDLYPDLTTDGRGNWVAVWESDDVLSGAAGSDKDIFVARSMDDGATWAPPIALNTNAGSDAGDDRDPRVTTDGRGTWLAVWYSDDSLRGTIGTDTDILVARSTDGGASWSAPTVLNGGSGDDFDPQLTTDGRGTWVAVWDSIDSLDRSIGTDRDILVARSSDGYTWSEPTGLDPNAASDAGDDFAAQVTTDGQGTWIAAWASFDALGGTIGADGDILVSRSEDDGVSWSAAAALDPNAVRDTGGDFAARVTTDGRGTWVAVWHSFDALSGTIGTDGDILVSRSTDGGARWSAAAALDPNAVRDTDRLPQVSTDGRGTWIAAWQSFGALGGTMGADGDILVSRSTDGGASWSAPAALNSNAGSDAGDDLGPHVTTDGQGTWLAVWHSFDGLGGTIGTDSDILVSRSTDDGVTWSAAYALDPGAGSDSGSDLRPRVATDGWGNWISVWEFVADLGGPLRSDKDILVSRSTNGGVTWTPPAALDPNADRDTGQDAGPQLATDGHGTWVALWESSGTLGGAIGQGRDILGAVLDPGLYQDTDSSGFFDPGEERAGGIGGDGGSAFDYVFDLDASTHDLRLTSIELLLTTYDHAFGIDINGVTVVPPAPGSFTIFPPSIDTPWQPNENGLPRLRIALTEASIEFAGSETTSSTPLDDGPCCSATSGMTPGLVYGQPTTNPVFVDGQNTITIENPDGFGDDGIDFRIRLRRGDLPYQKISDTQGGFTGLGALNLALASLGDLDGDGVGDLAARGPTGPGSTPEQREQGIWILFLNVDGTVKSYRRISPSEGGFDASLGTLGASITALGDLDGDGVTELANGENGDDEGGTHRGAATILFLNADGTVKSQQRISSMYGGFTGPLSDGDDFAIEVAFLGDLNGDGVPDMVAGARGDDDGGTNRGAVWILFLNADGTVGSHRKISDTEGTFTGVLDDHDLFGESVASLGDLDGDGIGDMAVSAILDDDGGHDRGAVWVLFLNADGTVKSHQKISDTEGYFTGILDDRDEFGESLSTLGDLDGDGVVDLAVGAFLDDDGGPNRGAVWILYLNSDGTVKSHEKISSTRGGFTGTLDDDDRFGMSVASLGDLSGDGGVGDLAVNAWFDDDAAFGAGAVWILFLDGAFCSDGIRNGGEQCDDGGFADGDGCGRTCQIEVQDSWELSGTATGGTVSFRVDGVALQLVTLVGETAADVATIVADAINSDPTLSTTGVFATATGSTIITSGTITDLSIEDLGLNPRFWRLGDLPGGEFFSAASAISADGSVVVGRSDSDGDEAFRWKDGVMTGLGGFMATPSGGACRLEISDLPFLCDSEAEDVSADGSVVVGQSGTFPFRWEDGVMTHVPCDRGVADFGSRGHAFAVSSDGSLVVGEPAFRWTEADGCEFIGTLPVSTSPSSSARGVSADGLVVVGQSDSEIGPIVNPPGCGPFREVREAFRWEVAGGCEPEGEGNPCMVGLGDLPGGAMQSLATDVSAGGSVVVGWSQSDLCSEAFRWEDGIMAGLGTVQSLGLASVAHAVSRDGSRIVGHVGGSSAFDPPVAAFLWDETSGMRSLESVLVDDFRLDLSGWTLTSATGISADGSTIVGDGINPDGFHEGWIAVVPEPRKGWLGAVALALLALTRRAARRRGSATPAPYSGRFPCTRSDAWWSSRA